MQNTIKWFEIPVSDINRATAFYEEILEIKMHRMELGEGFAMALFPASEEGVSGALVQNKGFYKPGTEGPMIYLNADPDLNIVIDRLKAKKANIIQAKKLISVEHGYMALFEDCEGNRIGLMSVS